MSQIRRQLCTYVFVLIAKIADFLLTPLIVSKRLCSTFLTHKRLYLIDCFDKGKSVTNHSTTIDSFKMDLYVLMLFSLNITSCLGLGKGLVSAAGSVRLARVEDLLETVINKNHELEKHVEHLGTELQEQKVLNDELLDRIFEL